MSKLIDFAKLSRPEQYTKNLFIFLPLVFAYKLTDRAALINALLAFINFSLVASAVYVFNDLNDIESDSKHPVKRHRPLASGKITRKQALGFIAFLLFMSSFEGLLLGSTTYWLIILTYVCVNIAYSLKLKHVAIVDIVSVAIGFVLRVFAGSVVTASAASHWVVLMTFLLALFLSLAKRRDDLVLAQSGEKTRKCLDGYSFESVSASMVVMAAVTIVSYVMYCVSPEIIAKHGTDNLYLSSFWVIIGLLRYMQITFVEERSGSPTDVLLRDVFLQSVIFLWLITCVILIS